MITFWRFDGYLLWRYMHCIYTVWQLIYSELFFIHFIFIASFSMVIKLCNSHGFRFFDTFSLEPQKRIVNLSVVYVDDLDVRSHSFTAQLYFFSFFHSFCPKGVSVTALFCYAYVAHLIFSPFLHLLLWQFLFLFFYINNRYNSFSCSLNGILLLLLLLPKKKIVGKKIAS